MHNPSSQNETSKKLKQVQSKLVYIERQYARMRNLERKQDTRRKIQLGGLVKKAGLDGEATAVIFGLLLEAKQKLDEGDSVKVRDDWRIIGDLALSSKQT